MSAAPAPVGGGRDVLAAMLAHLSGFVFAFLGWIPPLAVYLAERERSPFARHHAAEATNFQLTLLIPYLLSGVLYVVLGLFLGGLAWIGPLLVALIWLVAIVLGVIAASGANNGAWNRYPFALRLLK